MKRINMKMISRLYSSTPKIVKIFVAIATTAIFIFSVALIYIRATSPPQLTLEQGETVARAEAVRICSYRFTLIECSRVLKLVTIKTSKDFSYETYFYSYNYSDAYEGYISIDLNSSGKILLSNGY
jgi:hypothetical protein